MGIVAFTRRKFPLSGDGIILSFPYMASLNSICHSQIAQKNDMAFSSLPSPLHFCANAAMKNRFQRIAGGSAGVPSNVAFFFEHGQRCQSEAFQNDLGRTQTLGLSSIIVHMFSGLRRVRTIDTFAGKGIAEACVASLLFLQTNVASVLRKTLPSA